MAQLERYPRQVNTARTLSTPTVEKILRGSDSYKGSPTSSGPNSPSSPFDKSRLHDLEEDSSHNQKKSVLTKVKEKAKKLRYSLSKKKQEDGIITPAWAVTLEDEEEEEDAEYLGAPKLAPEAYKENARQHPRATPVIAENHILQSPSKSKAELDREKWFNNATAIKKTTVPTIATTPNYNPIGSSSDKKMTGNNNVSSSPTKLTPSYSSRRSDNHNTSSAIFSGPKIQGLTVSKPSEIYESPSSAPTLRNKSPLSGVSSPQTPPPIVVPKINTSKKPHFSSLSAPTTPHKSSSSCSSAATLTMKKSNSNDQTWEKGVSVKEFFINKLEPGEDEKALSQVISEVMSPRRTPGDVGVMEKVREAVNSLLRNEPSSQSGVRTPANTRRPSSSQIPEPVEEEKHGKILQTN
ncbi:mucin-5AC isoform X2 [Senna tora]|uniref:Mucin-5AC isoform X2 n=1 Tax=Senna tora TaxID=362788 RepID=A0A834TMH2_9FABA|nr:mucin-5AC isoform X2 [Senna tora]